ncbi:GNAT family N-acetyltransferase [Pseudomonas oryzihabitans]|uniref:GNAT family N-acetyltransferase n=1 Tax=Pseudomonas oryzihabitans TaxID=47885 RepID=UPI0028601781|nr:GNAT family N-acetyltransferase [Pseudomonas psychrotolerans]MDR6676157.1 ribosomal protein S18 acetylase RimI-like enzyme [Pseudomonas psychrotolerans]
MQLSHRPVQDSDLPALCKFSKTPTELMFWFPRAQFPLTPVQLQAAIAERRDNRVVEVDGRVVGFSNFCRWADEVYAIGNAIIDPGYRGRGIGRYLLKMMIGRAFETHGAREVVLSCFNANVTGLLLYQSLGFTPYAIEERRSVSEERVALIHLRLPRPHL